MSVKNMFDNNVVHLQYKGIEDYGKGENVRGVGR